MHERQFYCEKIIKWGKARAKEVSTWRGVAIAVGAVAVAVNPVAGAAVAVAMAKVVAVLDIITKENKE